jgi:uncharacterized protein YdaU (DUF1376 family)
MRRPKTIITTPYPTEEMVAAEMGISKPRLRELKAVLDEFALLSAIDDIKPKRISGGGSREEGEPLLEPGSKKAYLSPTAKKRMAAKRKRMTKIAKQTAK